MSTPPGSPRRATMVSAQSTANHEVSTSRARVVCLDSVLIDLTLVVDALPKRGGDSLASRRVLSAGGGFNMMSAACRQGASATYVGQLGHGNFAEVARAALRSEGIDMALASRGDIDLGVCVVLVDAAGERTFVTSPGAELSVSEGELDQVSVAPGDVVYVSGYTILYPETAQTFVSWLGALGATTRVVFDPGPRCADIDPVILSTVLTRSDWLLCNASEAEEMSGERDTARSAQALREEWGFEAVVVRAGAQGCVSADAEGLNSAPGFSARVVDTNGAGDVHNGVVIAETLRGTDWHEALLRANAAAATAISAIGPATCPPREYVDTMLQSQQRRVTLL